MNAPETSQILLTILSVLIFAVVGVALGSAKNAPGSNYTIAEFNGNSHIPDYIESYINAPFNNSFTASFWMYPTRVGNGIKGSVFSEDIVDIYNGTSNYNPYPELYTEWRGNGNLNENVCNKNGKCSGGWITRRWLNTWVFVAATYNKGSLAVYINGTPQQLIGDNSLEPDNWSAKGARAFISYIIPFSNNTVDDEFGGLLSNVQIYNESLSSNEVLSLYGMGIQGNPIRRGLVAWYKLDGNANDYSGNGFNGTIYGNVTFVPLR